MLHGQARLSVIMQMSQLSKNLSFQNQSHEYVRLAHIKSTPRHTHTYIHTHSVKYTLNSQKLQHTVADDAVDEARPKTTFHLLDLFLLVLFFFLLCLFILFVPKTYRHIHTRTMETQSLKIESKSFCALYNFGCEQRTVVTQVYRVAHSNVDSNAATGVML